ncbi:MAG: XylR family transcriptional regulator [Planctomycetaceae bacterium]|nr:XylR family transcriptional regulator [Planctomycetaceae bacterium]
MKRKKSILLLIESSSAYGRKLLKGISQYVRERDQWAIHIEDRGLLPVPALLSQGWKGDGIIARTPNQLFQNALNKCRCPVVELLRGDSLRDIEVHPDDYKSIEMCIEHYLERKITSVAFYAFGNCWWIKRRGHFFLDIAKHRRLNSCCFMDASSRKDDPKPEWEERYEKPLEKWLKSLPHRTGIIAANDAQAVKVLNACRLLEISVPEQLAVLGIDNDENLCNLTTPTLSSLDMNVEIVGYKAAELLDLRMNRKKTPPLPILIPPKGFVVRRSTDFIAINNPDVIAAVRYITEFAMQGITVVEVANHVHLSHSTLCRLFQKELKRSPKEEITRVRLNHAMFLLAQSHLSLRTIAKQCGYKTVEYFSEIFKSNTGETPMAYRTIHQKFSIPDSDG